MIRLLTVVFLMISTMAFANGGEEVIPKTAKISGLVKSLTDKEINIMEYGNPFNFDAENKVKIDAKGNFEIELELKEGQYYYVIYKRQSQLIYLNPGDDLEMVFDGRKINTTVTYIGSAKEANDFLKERVGMDKISQQMVNHEGVKYGLYQLDWDAYKKVIDENKAVMQTALDKFKKGKTKKGSMARFIKLEQANIDGTWGFFSMQYPAHHAHFTKKAPVDVWAGLDYTAIEKDLLKDDESLLMSKSYRDFLNQYIMALTERKLIESKTLVRSKSEFINRTYQNADNVFEWKWLQEYVKTRLLYEQIDKHGITNMEKSVNDFRTLPIKRNEYKVAVQKSWDKWALTMSGAQAPEIVGTNIDGKEVKLSDFKGKLVYVDVWATWCGPCRKEIPFLKATEEKYHGKDVVFLSVSIDKDKNKWQKMVVDQALGGVQIHMPGGWGADICKKYNITGIPRFMLIDKEGKIINTKTFRPSQNIGELLDKHL
ncbi:MAG: thiol-disulfide isomerase/thioredoxin [Maribacter sp.]|jgi:thiol-disulfide isomerase/thioredoxin